MKTSRRKSPLKILVAEDNRLTRLGLVHSLRCHGDLQVVGEARDGEEAVKLSGALQPDLVIMDIEMPVMDGISATQTIKELFPAIKVIMLTSSRLKERVYASLVAGADAYCLKDIRFEKLLEVIAAVANGEVWLDPDFARLIAELVPSRESNINNGSGPGKDP